MTNNLYGADALSALQQEDTTSSSKSFTKFNSGTTLKVKVLGVADLMMFYNYGIYKKVDSFVASNPSDKSKSGFPVGNLTPWDKAWKYHKDLSKDYQDAHGVAASQYRCKQRFAMAFYDLEQGEVIVIDVSKAQATAIHGTITKYEKKLDKLAFELSKSGAGTSTTVSLTPIIDMDEDLSDTERKNFADAPTSIPEDTFNGLLFEADEEEQIKRLVQAGFDISLIGLGNAPSEDATETNTDEEELPF